MVATARPTPTVTSYPLQNPNTYHPKVWGKKVAGVIMLMNNMIDEAIFIISFWLLLI